ncbi:putative chitinase [Microsporum canis]
MVKFIELVIEFGGLFPTAKAGPFQATYSDAGGSSEGANGYVVRGSGSWHSYETIDVNINQAIAITETQKPRGVNGNENWLSCDKFPFNSLKEGGAGAQVDCVPGYQQTIQSNVNILPRFVEQEVTWTDSQGQARAAFKSWPDNWRASGAVGRARNPNKDSAWNWELNSEKSFTFHLFNSDSLTTSTGSAYEVFNHKLKGGASGKRPKNDIDIVVAAINTFDNRKYRMPSHNAFSKLKIV